MQRNAYFSIMEPMGIRLQTMGPGESEINPKHWHRLQWKHVEDDRTSLNSHIKGEASDKTPNEGSKDVDHLTKLIDKPKPKIMKLH